MGMGTSRALAPALIALLSAAAAGCSSSSPSGPGNAVQNLIFWGSSTVPPAPLLPTDDDFECPPISVAANGAALRVGGETVRVQYSMGDIARECQNIQRDGSFALKIGVEGRVLLGAAGSPGRYDVPVHFTVKSGERVVASRAQRQAVVVPATGQASFQMIEQGIQVPAGLRDIEIEVGFGAGPAGGGGRRAARR